MTEETQPSLIASAGKIHLFDLGKLKERLGPKWDRMSRHVEQFFEAAIRRALKPGDTFSRFEELSYLIMFRELSPAEAEMKCGAISEEVCKRLFGENGEQVSMRNLVAHVGLTTIPTGADQKAALNARLERNGKETVITRRGAAAASPSAVSAKRFRLTVEGGAPSRQTVSHQEIAFAYRPIWDSINHVVLTYLCQPVLPGLSQAEATGFCVAEQETDQAALDLHILHECVDRATRLRAEGLRVILAAPVHFMTIARPRSWRDYSDALRKLPTEIARDFAYIVFGIDHGVPHIRLAQELPKLSRMAYRVFCVADRCQGVHSRFAKTGAHGIGAVLDEKDDELQSTARIREMAKDAQAVTIESFVLGLRTTSMALMSIDSGIRYLEGPVIRPAVSDPRHGFAQGVEDLYKARRLAGR